MHLDITIGLHPRFALLWINEAGILTIQIVWLILEIERLPPIDLERFDLEPASPPALQVATIGQLSEPAASPQARDDSGRAPGRNHLAAGSSVAPASPRR